jgi:uncharacterized protein
MAIIKSKYKAPFLYRNQHIATILPSIFRKVTVAYTRERIDTPDGDFLDIDWLAKGHDRAVILSHGLEGHSHRHYITATAKLFAAQGWDVIAWNCRSCSGEMNLKPRLYSHVDAPDLATVIDHVLEKHNYRRLALVGFSMGGAITLNYLTKMKVHHPRELVAAVAISAPVDVGGSSVELEKNRNIFYRKRFLKKMILRIKQKAVKFPDVFDLRGIDKISTFAEYDRRFTVPMHNCRHTGEFYKKASTHYTLDKLSIPTLLLIAENDPFMPASCYPFAVARDHEFFHLEVPKRGGHVGFTTESLKYSWMEGRALEFISREV